MATLDMSLDDRIRSRSNGERFRGQGMAPRGRGRGRGRGGPFNSRRMAGPIRRGPLSVNARPSAYAIAKASSKPLMIY